VATALVILGILVLIVFSRVNPWLTAMLVSGVIGYAIASFFMAHAMVPGWVLPASIVFWIVAATPGIAGFLMTIIPTRRRRDADSGRPDRVGRNEGR
jgi:hypothetical protein